MKTRFLIPIVISVMGIVVITSADVSYGLWVPKTPEKLFEQSETIFVGTIASVNVLEFERSNTYHVEENGVSRIVIENYTQTLDEYTVEIEEFLKNPQESNTITMLEATVGGVPGRSVSIGGFELGDKVLFYVPKIDGTNQYSPESQIIHTDDQLFYFQDEFKKFASAEVEKVNYVDFRDASGEIIEVGCSMGLRASGNYNFGGDFLQSLKCNPVITLVPIFVLIGIVSGVIFVIRIKRK